MSYEDIGISGTTGMEEDGVAAGETYIYLDAEKMGKLMVLSSSLCFISITANSPLATYPSGAVSVVEVVAITKCLERLNR